MSDSGQLAGILSGVYSISSGCSDSGRGALDSGHGWVDIGDSLAVSDRGGCTSSRIWLRMQGKFSLHLNGGGWMPEQSITRVGVINSYGELRENRHLGGAFVEIIGNIGKHYKAGLWHSGGLTGSIFIPCEFNYLATILVNYQVWHGSFVPCIVEARFFDASRFPILDGRIFRTPTSGKETS